MSTVALVALLWTNILLSLTRHEDRPDFKKVAESMKTYYYSISSKAKLDGATAAAELVK